MEFETRNSRSFLNWCVSDNCMKHFFIKIILETLQTITHCFLNICQSVRLRRKDLQERIKDMCKASAIHIVNASNWRSAHSRLRPTHNRIPKSLIQYDGAFCINIEIAGYYYTMRCNNALLTYTHMTQLPVKEKENIQFPLYYVLSVSLILFC